MNLAQKILRVFHPEAEEERMRMRQVIAEASAVSEDVARTVTLDRHELERFLRENCAKNHENCK